MSKRDATTAIAALEEATGLSADARALVERALRTPADLADAIASVPGAKIKSEQVSEIEDETAIEPIYLSRISACGFRGIAERLDLELQPTPGLVLITGRNGSGKSSLAEAAEVALCGSSDRSSSTLWSKGLSNLHYEGATSVEINLRVDGSTDVVLECRLDGDVLAGAARSATSGGNNFDLTTHGIADAVDRYRPVLTFNALSALASAKPSELYDPINNILGLDDLTSADRALTQAATEEGRAPKAASAARTALLAALKASDDPRSIELHTALHGKSPDLEAARDVLAGTAGAAASSRQTLSGWAGLTSPEPEEAATAVATLGDAVARHKSVAAGAAGRAKRLAEILELAIAHREHADDLCPVCGQGQLDHVWLAEAQERAKLARQEAAEAQSAEAALRTARNEVRRFIPAVPSALGMPTTDDVDPTEASTAWKTLVELNEPTVSDDALVSTLVQAVSAVARSVRSLASAASVVLSTRDTEWQPLAEQAQEVIGLIEKANVASLRVVAITEARDWLRNTTAALRETRLGRFAEDATSVWEGLRQDSNVALGGIKLVGANTRREVQLDLTVDGTPGPQAVLSQGELAALGLALFLPRSTAEASPFRFVLIDDPVQSMDPSKIDGLARVLHQLAMTRQVVVFTHDDRLLQALRRLALPATSFRIDRGEQSRVSVQRVDDPVDQHLRDADALAKDAALPADLLAIATSGYCRDALDEAATDLARRRLLANGARATSVDATLATASSSRGLLALAMLGDSRKSGSALDKALANQLGAEAKAIIQACIEGVHEADAGSPRDLLAATKVLVDALRGMT